MMPSLLRSLALLAVLCSVMWLTYPFGLVVIALGAMGVEAWKMARRERWYPRLRALAGRYDEGARSCAGCTELIFDDFEHDFCDTPADHTGPGDQRIATFPAESVVLSMVAALQLAEEGRSESPELYEFVRSRWLKGDPGPLYLANGVATTEQWDEEQARKESKP